MTTSHWRFATSAGLLAVGLMANAGGAVAVADAGSDTTVGADGPVAAANHGSTHATGPVGSIAENVRATIQGAADALNPGHLTRPQLTNGAPSIAVPPMMAASIRAYTPITGVSAPRQNSATPTPNSVTPRPGAATPYYATAQNDVADTVTTLSTALASTTKQVAQATNQVAQATSQVVSPATAALSAGVQSVVAPIPDVLTSIQALLTSTAAAVAPVTQFPSDLASLFGITTVQPVSGQIGVDSDGPSSAPLPAPLPPARPLAVDQGSASAIADAAAGTSRATATATPTAVSGVTSAIVGASSLNAAARTAPAGAMSEGLQKFFHSYGALVIAASLSALIAAALPGIFAFLIPTAAGVGVGYRQAKAGIALRGPGLARFAGSGPVGIVRTGSMITLRSSALRTARPARPEVASPSHLAA